jgi:hypothetical protein
MNPYIYIYIYISYEREFVFSFHLLRRSKEMKFLCFHVANVYTIRDCVIQHTAKEREKYVYNFKRWHYVDMYDSVCIMVQNSKMYNLSSICIYIEKEGHKTTIIWKSIIFTISCCFKILDFMRIFTFNARFSDCICSMIWLPYTHRRACLNTQYIYVYIYIYTKKTLLSRIYIYIY